MNSTYVVEPLPRRACVCGALVTHRVVRTRGSGLPADVIGSFCEKCANETRQALSKAIKVNQ